MRLTVLLLATMTVTSLAAFAQPSSIGPQDVARLKQHTDFTNQWFDTNLYDLKNPVELFVTIQGLYIPERGYAEILYTVNSVGRGAQTSRVDSEQVFTATLQLADTLKYLKSDVRRFQRGMQARILGWPATEENVTNSVLLVDEISMGNGREPIRFHPDHPNMKTLRAKPAESK